MTATTLTFINTNELPRVKTPQGEFTDFLKRLGEKPANQ